jgi:hypothetical protein
VVTNELTPEMTGRWLVRTQGSWHLWDLDAMTYMREPGPESKSGSFAHDGKPMTITRVDFWPKVGATSLVFYDDPDDPTKEQWRWSSTIRMISPAGPAGQRDAEEGPDRES